MQIDRNGPCPCGSGKKYKKCCFLSEEIKRPTIDLRYQRISKVRARIMDQTSEFVMKCFGPDALHEAWEDWDEVEGVWYEQSSTEQGVFLSWVFFGWDPATVGYDGPVTVAEYYLEKLGHLSSRLEQDYVRAGLQTGFSFFRVCSITWGVGLEVEDVLTKEVFFVHEVKGSQSGAEKCILFGKVIPVDGIYVFDGIREMALDLKHLVAIVNFRHFVLKALDKSTNEDLTSEDLVEFDEPIRCLFAECREMDLDPKMPELQNTDGEKMELSILEFRHDDMLSVFDRLADLSVMSSKEEILERAERNADGVIESLTFDWDRKGNKMHKSWTNTVLAQLFLKPKTLTIEVNSNERAERIQALVQEKCGDLVVLERKGPNLKEAKPLPPQGPMDPVVKAAAIQMLTGMYKDWLKKKIPALGYKTPLQSVKTSEGRELVDALLIEMEPDMERMLEESAPDVIKMLRQKLGFISKK